MEPNKKKIRVVGAAIIDSGKVLVAQRPVSDKAYKSLKWEFPGGKVEDGETEVETAIREVKEETNIDVEVDEEYRYSTKYSPKEDVIKEVIYFLARNISDNRQAQLEEVSEVKWFSMEDAIDKITYDTSRDILIQLKQDLEKKGYM